MDSYIDATKHILDAVPLKEACKNHFQIVSAMHFCMKAHAGQWRRKNRVPYALHPFRVMSFIREVLGINDTDVLCTALLHDTIEDCKDVTFEVLVDQFGHSIADVVVELTNDGTLPRKEKKEAMIKKAASFSVPAIIVKSVDRIDNLSDSYVNFSEEKIWHYTLESISLFKSLDAAVIRASMFEQLVFETTPIEAERAVDHLSSVIGTIIARCRIDRKLTEFNELAKIWAKVVRETDKGFA